MSDRPLLFTDEEIVSFIIRGYLLLHPDFRPDLNELVCEQLDREGTSSVVNFANDADQTAILRRAPALQEVFEHPRVHGAIVSLLGNPYTVYERFCHAIKPGQGRAYWHVDDVPVRHHLVRRIQLFYYPQTVTVDMAPTLLVPGTHFRIAPSDRLQTYGNIRTQVAMCVPAGTVAVLHYDIWHTPTRNTSNKTRYMIHLYCRRNEEPTQATWKHNPAYDATALTRFHSDPTGGVFQTAQKLTRLHRLEMWQYLLGQPRLSQLHPEGVQGYLTCLQP